MTLAFPAGLTELSGDQKCQSGPPFSVSTRRGDGTVKTQRYCKSGAASPLELFGATSVDVEVPKGEEMQGTQFTVKAAPRGEGLRCFHCNRK